MLRGFFMLNKKMYMLFLQHNIISHFIFQNNVENSANRFCWNFRIIFHIVWYSLNAAMESYTKHIISNDNNNSNDDDYPGAVLSKFNIEDYLM